MHMMFKRDKMIVRKKSRFYLWFAIYCEIISALCFAFPPDIIHDLENRPPIRESWILLNNYFRTQILNLKSRGNPFGLNFVLFSTIKNL